MTYLEESLAEVKGLIKDAGTWRLYPLFLGGRLAGTLKHLKRLVAYVEIVKEVGTEHDAEAEMDAWDEFFEERKETARAQQGLV